MNLVPEYSGNFLFTKLYSLCDFSGNEGHTLIQPKRLLDNPLMAQSGQIPGRCGPAPQTPKTVAAQ